MKTMLPLMLALLFAVTIAAPARSADEAAVLAAEELLESINLDQLLSESIDSVLSAQVQQEPVLRQHEAGMRRFLRKHMSYASLKPDLVRIYAEAFTAAELRELTAFYRTPLGVKTVSLMPRLMQQGSELGMQRVQENMHELEAMLRGDGEPDGDANGDSDAKARKK